MSIEEEQTRILSEIASSARKSGIMSAIANSSDEELARYTTVRNVSEQGLLAASVGIKVVVVEAGSAEDNIRTPWDDDDQKSS